MYDPTGHLPGAVPSRVLTALRGETKRLDAPVSVPAFSLSPAERAQDRAETYLTDLTTAMLSRGSDPTTHAQRMAVATHAAAQALLSAYVLWLAQAEAGGLSVPVPVLTPIAAEHAPDLDAASVLEAHGAIAALFQDLGSATVTGRYV